MQISVIFRFIGFSFLISFFSSSALWATDTALVNSKPICDSKENNDTLGNQANDVLKITQIERIQTIASDFWKMGMECPERVWPSLTDKMSSIILTDPLTQSAFILNDPNVSELKRSELHQIRWSEKWNIDGYKYQNNLYHGRPGLIFNIHWGEARPMSPMIADDQPKTMIPDLTFAHSFHEYFHSVNHARELERSSEERRGMKMPIDLTAQLLRQQLIYVLKEANLASSSKMQNAELRKAACLKKKFDLLDNGKERQRNLQIDRAEGSARYVEALVSILTKIGENPCSINLEKMNAKAIARFNDQNEVASRIEPIDGQSYSIGLQAGFLLKQRKPGWEVRLDQETDRTMIDLLLEDVEPETECEIEPRIKTYGDNFKIQMKNFEEKTLELMKNLKSNDYVKVALPEGTLNREAIESFGPNTYTDELQKDTVIRLAMMNVRGSTEKSTFTWNGSAFRQNQTPCGVEPRLVILLPRGEIKTEGGALSLKENSSYRVKPRIEQKPLLGSLEELRKKMDEQPLPLVPDSLELSAPIPFEKKPAATGGEYLCF